jgi:hypothetical protein
MGSRSLLPAVLLAAGGLAFAGAALGRGPLGGDDHPGQLYRFFHAARAPWGWSAGWWAGYPELGYYPPGAAWLGALIELAAPGPERAYQVLLWIAYLAPGFGAYALLRRATGDAWLALPGAVIVLTLSAGCRSGVEEGLRWGLVASRLAWALLPVLGLTLLRWLSQTAPPPVTSALLVAAVALTHPAQLPAAAVLLVSAALLGPGPRRRRLAGAVAIVGLGLSLAAFWLVPLVVHLDMARPLAWGDRSLTGLARRLLDYPVLGILAAALALTVSARRAARPAPERWLLAQAPAMAAVVVADALLLAPAGVLWLPADRVADGLWLALALGSAPALASMARLGGRPWPRLAALGALALLPVLAAGRDEPGLTLWPRPGQWPTLGEVVRGLRMETLWQALGEAPPGRVLFLRSAVPLAYRPEWWRPHSHVTALTPARAGREIVGGTFTHPSPLAALFYTGSPDARSAVLAEELDGRVLLGEPLERLNPARFAEVARRLRVSVVVALDEDAGRLGFLGGAADFRPWRRLGPFLLFVAPEPRPLPEPLSGWVAAYRVRVEAGPGWSEPGLAWSPLWRAEGPAGPLPTRRSALGLLEVRRPPGPGPVVLRHGPGPAEWLGLGLSAMAAALAAGAALAATRRRWRG